MIQSFKPGEVTPEQCNQLGLELAEKIAPNHQVAVYTHADTNHVHNHIVINSIDLETGKNIKAIKTKRVRKTKMMKYVENMDCLYLNAMQQCDILKPKRLN